MFDFLAAPRRRNILLLGFGLPLLAVFLLVIAWATDSGANDRVRRNVVLGTTDIGRATPAELEAVVSDVAADIAASPMAIVTPTARIPFSASDIGVSLDEDATAERARDLGTTAPAALRPFRWVATWFSTAEAPLVLDVDADALTATLDAADAATSRPAIEPTVEYRNGEITVRPGDPGQRVDSEAAVRRLREIDGYRGGPIELTVRETIPIEPQISNEAAASYAESINRGTAETFELTVGDEVRQLEGPTLRRLLRLEQVGDEFRFELDDDEVMSRIERLFDDAKVEPTESLMTIENRKVVVDQGAPGSQCCDPSAVGELERAIANEQFEVRLESRPFGNTPEQDVWTSLGIVERVSTFRTNYTPGQSRNLNIQRIADLTRGVIIEPGETFSVNDFVGRRTKEKGFVEAGVIYRGVFTDDVGGGISQFATTLFNAAFFAGLEFGEYQSHSIYLARYPYGREATLSFPNPDLEIENISPYGVMIWPSYDDSGIRVDLYSTRWAEAGQTGQRTREDGVCTVVITERTRTFLETGEVDVDNVIARYRPEQGLNCDGSDSNPDNDLDAPGDTPNATPLDEDTPAPAAPTTTTTTTPTTTAAPTTTTTAPAGG